MMSKCHHAITILLCIFVSVFQYYLSYLKTDKILNVTIVASVFYLMFLNRKKCSMQYTKEVDQQGFK